MGTPGPLAVLAALRIEALAIGGKVHVVGMGPAKARRSGNRLADRLSAGSPVAVLGLAGGLDHALGPGHVVVASTVRVAGEAHARELPEAPTVAAALRQSGIDAQVVDLVSTSTLTRRAERAAFAEEGARVVDMESAWLAQALGDHPLVVVRVVADGIRHGYVAGGIKGLAMLHRLRGPIERWAATHEAHVQPHRTREVP